MIKIMTNIKQLILTLVALFAISAGAWAENPKVKYALTSDLTISSGTTVEVKDGTDVVATITYSETGGSDFTTKATTNISALDGYTAYTEGNGKNGDKTGGTFYTIVPAYDGTIDVAVILSAGKPFYILEDGTALTDYNGITKSDKYYGTFSFAVSKDKAYKLYCSSGKLGFYGFEYTFGAAAEGTALTPDATRKIWTLDAMPAGDVELEVEYYPGMLTLPASLTGGTLSVVGLTAPLTKLDVPDAWENDNTLLSAAHLPGFKEMSDDAAQKWEGAPKEGLASLIYGFEGTKAKAADYAGGIFALSGTQDLTLSTIKTASAEGEIYYSSEAQMPAGFETDGTNIYVADKTEFQVKATPADGFHLVSLMFGETDVTDQVDADGIATLTMPEGNADITLTATFSDKYTVSLNAEGLSDEEAANWKAATGDNVPAALPLENVKAGTEVKVTYGGSKKVIGVKAEKKVDPKKLTVGNVTFYYDEGQTFTEAKQKYADLNSGWILNGPYISVQGAISIVLFKGESPVEGTSKIEPNAEYSWINFS